MAGLVRRLFGCPKENPLDCGSFEIMKVARDGNAEVTRDVRDQPSTVSFQHHWTPWSEASNKRSTGQNLLVEERQIQDATTLVPLVKSRPPSFALGFVEHVSPRRAYE